MYENLTKTINDTILTQTITDERKSVLQPLIDYLQQKNDKKETILLNFICTHNSRRSHLAQVWAQAAAHFYGIKNVESYSGGTAVTAVSPQVIKTIENQGFATEKLSDGNNPLYAIKYAATAMPMVGFSKKYDHFFNPKAEFAAIMTCSQADGGCPFIDGAEKRVPITFEDPKVADGTPEQAKVYAERSVQIASEMFYVFSQIDT